MAEVFDYSSQLPIDKVTIATSSNAKRRANQTSIEGLAGHFNVQIPVEATNPEIYEPESDSEQVDYVAWLKTETLRKNTTFTENERTLLAAFDVVTLIGSEEDLDAGRGEDLKRLMRDMHLDGELDAKAKWAKIIQTLEFEKARMLERCVNNAFSIEWHIGFAINSNDSKIANRAALVLRATFDALEEDIVLQAFTMSDDLKKMQEMDQVPTSTDLTTGVQALAIGPRLPFAELLPRFANAEKLTIRNRDYPEVAPVAADTETFLRLVKDCALPPWACLQLLAGSLDEEGTPESQLEKPTVLVTQVT